MANKTISKISLLGSKDRSQNIEDLARAGYALFPMSGYTKVPAVVGWPDTPHDEFKSGDDFKNCNYGAVLREIDLVLDVDPRNFAPGDNPLERLAISLGIEKFETYTVITATGGLHIYLRKPAGVAIRKKHKAFEGIDFLSSGAFVVGPGSVIGKKPYFVAEGSPDNLLEADPRLVQLIERNQTQSSVGISEVTDDSPTRDRFIAYMKATEPAYSGERNDKAYAMACMARDFGLSEEMACDLMREHWQCEPMLEIGELVKTVGSAYKCATNEIGNRHPEADFEPLEDIASVLDESGSRAEAENSVQWNFSEGKNGRQILKPDITNVSNHFKIPDFQGYVNPVGAIVKYNTFSKMVDFVKPAPWHNLRGENANWSKIDTIMMKSYLCKLRGWNTPTELIHEAMLSYAHENTYHPVRDYLASLQWDGVPRIDKLFIDYASAPDDDYVRAVSRCTLLAAVARIMVPGIKHDYIPIMEGDQGRGKSEFVKILGGEWYAGFNLDVGRLKDTIVKMFGSWIIEVPDFTCARQADENELKAFITTTRDVERLPYDRDKSVIKRESIFIATFNPRRGVGYFKDPTGNRRFWPVETGIIRTDELARDRDQLFAEAYYRFFLGEAHWITDKRIRDLAQQSQEERTEGEAWAVYIQSWLDKEAARGENHVSLPTAFIAQDILNIAAKDTTKHVFTRIAQAMDEIGWIKNRVVVGGKRSQGYRSPDYPGVGKTFDARIELDQLLDGI